MWAVHGSCWATVHEVGHFRDARFASGLQLFGLPHRFGPGETATWKPAAAGEVSAFAAALRAVDEMDPETARLMLHRGRFYYRPKPLIP